MAGELAGQFGQGLGQGVSLYNALQMQPLQKQALQLQNQGAAQQIQQAQQTQPFTLPNGEKIMLSPSQTAQFGTALGAAKYNADALANRVLMGQMGHVGEETQPMKVQKSAALSAVNLFDNYKSIYNAFQPILQAQQSGNAPLVATMVSQLKQKFGSDPTLGSYVADLNPDASNAEIVGNNLRQKIGGEYQKLNSGSSAEVPAEEAIRNGNQMLPPLTMPPSVANQIFKSSADTFFGSKFDAAMNNTLNAADPITHQFADPVMRNQYLNEQQQKNQLMSSIPPDYVPGRNIPGTALPMTGMPPAITNTPAGTPALPGFQPQGAPLVKPTGRPPMQSSL